MVNDIVVTSSVRLELESGPSLHVHGVDVDERRNDILVYLLILMCS